MDSKGTANAEFLPRRRRFAAGVSGTASEVAATVVKTVQMRVDTRTPDWETQLAEVVGRHAGNLFSDCEVEDVAAEVLADET